MVKQYPDIMTWSYEPPYEGGFDEDGYPVPPPAAETKESICRYENWQKSSSREFNNQNGDVVLQKGTVYVKKGEPLPSAGEIISVNGGDRFKGEVLNVYKGQLNSTIAV